MRMPFGGRSRRSHPPNGARDAIELFLADAREARAAEQLNGADPGRYAPGSAPLHPTAARLISRPVGRHKRLS